MDRGRNLRINDAEIMYKNFSGKVSKYNPNGNRSVTIVVPTQEIAERLLDEGWNVKTKYVASDPDADPKYILELKIKYDPYPPEIYMVMMDSKKKVLLDEETVGNLDRSEIINADIIVRPSHWSVNGRNGVAGYVKKMFVVVEEDDFDKKYDFDEPIEEDETPF